MVTILGRQRVVHEARTDYLTRLIAELQASGPRAIAGALNERLIPTPRARRMASAHRAPIPGAAESLKRFAPKREGCTTIRFEKRSGTSRANARSLRTVLDFLRKGDVLMVTRIDRLARSASQRRLVEGDRAADRHQHDGGQSFLDMLGVFAEFETNLRRERQLEGIAKVPYAIFRWVFRISTKAGGCGEPKAAVPSRMGSKTAAPVAFRPE
jgi:hypothetical protein